MDKIVEKPSPLHGSQVRGHGPSMRRSASLCSSVRSTQLEWD